MATVRLHGHLQRFGRVFRLEVATPAEAIRALSLQITGFRGALESGAFRVRLRRHDLTADNVEAAITGPVGERDVFHLVPVVAGAKNGGLFNVIMGAVMVVAAFYTGGASIAAWGAMSTGLAVAGAGMMLAGAATMLSPVPKGGAGASGGDSNNNSSFSSLDNRVAQGGCVPLIYGQVMTGSVVLSQEVETL